MRSKVILTVAVATSFALGLMVAFFILLPPKSQCGYAEVEGFLELRAYPKISESVPTVMVYALIPMYDHSEIYLTDDGLPLSSLEEFSENDLVRAVGVLYSRDAVDGSRTYQMAEIFSISEGD